jgi:anthranilate synthase component 1/para-aminobenzoate synthetase
MAVDGRSGAGKTVLAADLAVTIARRDSVGPVTVLSMEGLYRGWHGLAAGVRLWAGDVLPRLRRGLTARYPAWDWRRGGPGAEAAVPGTGLVIAEGVGSAAAAARPRLDLVVWLEAPEHVRRRRAEQREGGSIAEWWTLWASQEEELLADDPIPGEADAVVDATSPDPGRWPVTLTAVGRRSTPAPGGAAGSTTVPQRTTLRPTVQP